MSGSSGLGVAQRTALGMSDNIRCQHESTEERGLGTTGEVRYRNILHMAPHFANGFMTASRKLSAQIIFIMTSTNRVPGISASRRFGFSSRRCMKNMTARYAWMAANSSMRQSEGPFAKATMACTTAMARMAAYTKNMEPMLRDVPAWLMRSPLHFSYLPLHVQQVDQGNNDHATQVKEVPKQPQYLDVPGSISSTPVHRSYNGQGNHSSFHVGHVQPGEREEGCP